MIGKVIGNGARYRGINFMNLAKGGKNTIEFRLSNGTVDPEVWIQNINLFGGLIKIAEELSIIQRKNEYELTEEEKKKLKLFDTLINENDLNERDKMKKLIELIIEEKDERQVYFDRYDTNSVLIEALPLGKMLDERISKYGTRLSKNRIWKAVFKGKKPITGTENKEVTEYINAQLNVKFNEREGNNEGHNFN